ncbi:MAG: SIS domain-containing protein [Phycisphaerales bacterium]|nr:SIS domain-containing protein [Phycisphaerales bacterium]
MPFDRQFIEARIAAAAAALEALQEQSDLILQAGRTVRERLRGGGKILTCGNGGSAAEALHLAEELIGKYRDPRRPWPAVCLNADPTALTCIANDFGYDHVFARQVEGLGQAGDVLVVFTTSGNSANIRLALEQARRAGVVTVGLLGKDGGTCRGLCDVPVVAPGGTPDLIQECHQVIMHLLLEAVEADDAPAG